MTTSSGDAPKPKCPLGYPHSQLEEWLGAESHSALNEWLNGQTQAICEGREYNHDLQKYEFNSCADSPHGLVAYKHDVLRWWNGEPIEDW